jgi:DNA-binding transcriptional MerR regulator
MEKLYSVKDVRELTGLTGKELYYFDHENVVPPTSTSNYSVEGNRGYKLYDDAAVARLQQIAMYYELGLKRNEIRDIMKAPDYEVNKALDELTHALEEKRLKPPYCGNS